MAKKLPDNRQDTERNEPHRFDKIIRQNMPVLFPLLMEKVFGLHIVESTPLRDKIQTTRQLEVDALHKVLDADGSTYIAHLEIQTSNDSDMAIRLLEYRAMLRRIYGLAVRQFVLYIGEDPMTMPDGLDEPGLHFSYLLMDFSTLPHEWFLRSEHMEERLLSILGELGGKSPERLMEEVVWGIDRAPVDGVTKNKYFRQLRIIAQLRSFTQTKKVRDIMLKAASFFRVEKDPFYQQGEEKGIEQGMEKGIEQGIEKGIEQGIEKGAEARNNEFVSNLILQTDFDDSRIASLAGVTIEFVHRIRMDLAKGR